MASVELALSPTFLAQYEYKQPKWGFNGLGYIVYLRTYARKQLDGTLERWDQTVKRVTEGNFQIEARRLAQLGKLTSERLAQLMLEMERFYHLTFNLVFTPPGRGLWMSGTPYAERVGDAENNCWMVSMRPQPYQNDELPKVGFAPSFTFDQAMKGGGVGVNVQHVNVDQIPQVNNTVNLHLICDPRHVDYSSELIAYGVLPRSDDYEPDETYVLVPDSREGWAQILGQVVDAHYEGVSNLTVDISDIRPRNSEIKGFGGIASGPGPLVDMLQKVNVIINRRVGDNVTPTEWGDVIQNIGCCVVAGNVRRTALILIGDQDDQFFVQSKNYDLPENLEGSQWRWASNNSVDISAATSYETLREMANNIYYNGEPGYVNIDLARNYGRIIDGYQPGIDAEVEGFNPLT